MCAFIHEASTGGNYGVFMQTTRCGYTWALALLFRAKASCLSTKRGLGVQHLSRVICSGVNLED
jgi:hypothetical protein